MKTTQSMYLMTLSLGLSIVSCVNAQEKKEQTPVKIEKTMENYKTTPTGLKYNITQQGKGKQAKPGDLVYVHYTGTLEDGKKFDSSLDRGEPLMFKLGAGMVIKGWDEGISMLTVGSKAKLWIPSNLGYGEKGAGALIAPNSNLNFEVELVDAIGYDTTGIKPQVTASGLKIYKTKTTSNAKPNVGQKVSVHYSGYLLNGTKFDSSVDRFQPFQFDLGKGKVIKGWDEGIALLNIGEAARLVIPAAIAYGAQGAGGVIPPNADLIFDVLLLKAD